jgi:hypothetical protein
MREIGEHVDARHQPALEAKAGGGRIVVDLVLAGRRGVVRADRA